MLSPIRAQVTSVLNPEEWEEVNKKTGLTENSQCCTASAAAIVGLSPTSTWPELQTAYCHAIKQWHPDHGLDDAESALFMVAVIEVKVGVETAYKSVELLL